jgi:hypothetical protein
MALAGKIEYNICILNLAERGLTDDRLAMALSVVPPQVILQSYFYHLIFHRPFNTVYVYYAAFI